MTAAKLLWSIALLAFLMPTSQAQYWQQYFDGADTTPDYSIIIQIDTTDSTNVWQVGPPQKMVFDTAFSPPNVLVTDTINTYPINANSSVEFEVVPWISWGIFAMQWTQKIDMDDAQDGGLIEYSLDNGTTWESVFDNPYVYNFYGYDTSNVDTIHTGQTGFTGTDSTWRNVWLCFDFSWMTTQVDTLDIRFTFVSDSVDNMRDGWMIDNLFFSETFIHTLNKVEQDEYMAVYPNPTNGRVFIETQKINDFHLIEQMVLYDASGRIVQTFGASPTKFFIDIDHHPDGIYFLEVQTTERTETHQIVLQR